MQGKPGSGKVYEPLVEHTRRPVMVDEVIADVRIVHDKDVSRMVHTFSFRAVNGTIKKLIIVFFMLVR